MNLDGARSAPDGAARRTARRADGGAGAERRSAVALVQGAFYLGTGIWPLVSAGTFQAVTGSKTDVWLVKTVGGLVGVTGAALVMAGLRRRVPPELALVAAGNAAVLAAIDVIYTAKRRIPPVYLLDAAAETVLIAAWGVAGMRDRSPIAEPKQGEISP